MPTEEELNKRFPIPEPRSEIVALELQLSRTAANWRASKDAKFVKQYHDIYHKLRSLGWDNGIDAEAELPDELMPQAYLDEIHATEARH